MVSGETVKMFAQARDRASRSLLRRVERGVVAPNRRVRWKSLVVYVPKGISIIRGLLGVYGVLESVEVYSLCAGSIDTPGQRLCYVLTFLSYP